jgi:phage terminase Nu1 subunit (DNA packaging protein)
MSRRDSSSLEKERIGLIKAQADYEELKVAQARAEQIPSDVLVMA